MPTSQISATLAEADRKAILDALEGIKAKLPFLVDLTTDERKALPRMGDKSRAFVAKALEIATQNPGMLPRSFDLDEFRQDAALLEALYPVALALAQLQELVDDTLVAAGSDAYTAALVVYQSAKLAGKGEGMDEHLDALGARFARRAKAQAELQS